MLHNTASGHKNHTICFFYSIADMNVCIISEYQSRDLCHHQENIKRIFEYSVRALIICTCNTYLLVIDNDKQEFNLKRISEFQIVIL